MPINKITKIECLGQTEHYSLDDTQINDFKYYFNTCIKGISHSINIIQALLMRLIFSLHSLIAIGYVYLVKQDEWYLVNIIGVVFLFIELFVTIIQRKGKEPNSWFFPCFFIYIGTMIPPIWFVELTRIQQANSRRHLFSNESTYDLVENIVQTFGADQLQINAVNIILFIFFYYLYLKL